MKAIQRLKEMITPAEQPRPGAFPRLYLVPETHTVKAPRTSANNHLYSAPILSRTTRVDELASPAEHIPAPLLHHPREGLIARLKRCVRERIELAIAEAWEATKSFGRRVVHWLAWRVFMPLSVVASIWVPGVNPMELPF